MLAAACQQQSSPHFKASSSPGSSGLHEILSACDLPCADDEATADCARQAATTSVPQSWRSPSAPSDAPPAGNDGAFASGASSSPSSASAPRRRAQTPPLGDDGARGGSRCRMRQGAEAAPEAEDTVGISCKRERTPSQPTSGGASHSARAGCDSSDHADKSSPYAFFGLNGGGASRASPVSSPRSQRCVQLPLAGSRSPSEDKQKQSRSPRTRRPQGTSAGGRVGGTKEPAASVNHRIASLRAALDAELAEKRRTEAQQASLSAKLADSEAQAERLAAELQEIRQQRDALRLQLSEQSTKSAEVLRELRQEQDTQRRLEADVAKAESSLRELETRAGGAGRLREAQQKTPEDSPATACGSLESQLQQLRMQLEETVRVVQSRPRSQSASKALGRATANGEERLPAAIGASAFSSANISSLETASPSSSADAVGLAAASSVDAEELQDMDNALLPAVAVAAPVSSAAAGLSLRDLSEIKTLKKPPPPVRMLMEICCLLFQISPVKHVDERNPKSWCYDYWEPARRYLLSDPFFPHKLRTYNASAITPAQRSRVLRYFRDPEFSAERVNNCCRAASELYDWVRAVIGQDASGLSA